MSSTVWLWVLPICYSMDSANVLIVELFRLEGTFEHHLVLSSPTLPFSSLSAGYTLKLYGAAESLYGRAVKPRPGRAFACGLTSAERRGAVTSPSLLSVLLRPSVCTHP